jgi:hypothetical protein
MLKNRGKMPLPQITFIWQQNCTKRFKIVVGVASSHEKYAPLLNRIAPCYRTKSGTLILVL